MEKMTDPSQATTGAAGQTILIGDLAQDATTRRAASTRLADRLVEQCLERGSAPPDHAVLADALDDALQRARPTATVRASGCPLSITCLSTREGDALVHVVLEDAE